MRSATQELIKVELIEAAGHTGRWQENEGDYRDDVSILFYWVRTSNLPVNVDNLGEFVLLACKINLIGIYHNRIRLMNCTLQPLTDARQKPRIVQK